MVATGHEPLYLACYDGQGNVIAVIPFFVVRRKRFLGILESLPEGLVGGPIIRKDESAVARIIKSLPTSLKFSASQPIVSMKLRVNRRSIVEPLLAEHFSYWAGFGYFVLDLFETSEEHIWNETYRKHDRQAIKYYEASDTSFDFARNEAEYYDYMAYDPDSNIRAPISSFSRKYVAIHLSNLGERYKVGRIMDEGKTIAAFSLICDNENSTVYTKGLRYSRMKNILSPVIYANWKIAKWASKEGFRYIDFGWTSADPMNGSHQLKLRMGGTFAQAYEFNIPVSSMFLSLPRAIAKTLWRAKNPTLSQSRLS